MVMMRKATSRTLLWIATVALLFLASSTSLSAQDSVLTAQLSTGPLDSTSSTFANAPTPAMEPATPFVIARPTSNERLAHRFWDRENTTLFAATAGWAAADFCVTRANLANGGRELNPVARMFTGSTPALAANFALETGGTVGIAYVFHRTGHHKLERLTSVVDISGSAGAVIYGLVHR